ncbi:hypothetical protein [Glaciecola sp. SC05]|uniref:hypothetical protein n=1 Tax=Glaciecola sp. SC05 TaxID=1987355 RepID=UPI0035299C59
MAKTRHIQKRMSQRAIEQVALDIVKQFGVDSGDKTILNEKALQAAMQELKRLHKHMDKMKSRGGLVLVEQDGYELTAYALRSFNKSKAIAA